MQVELATGEKLEFRLPDDLDQYVWESKGYYSEAEFQYAGRLFKVSFYDPTRLAQEIEAGLQNEGLYFEKNLVVVPEINTHALVHAVRKLVESGRLHALVPHT